MAFGGGGFGGGGGGFGGGGNKFGQTGNTTFGGGGGGFGAPKQNAFGGGGAAGGFGGGTVRRTLPQSCLVSARCLPYLCVRTMHGPLTARCLLQP